VERTRKIVITIWFLLSAVPLVALDWQFGGLRFDSPYADFVVGMAALWLPVVSAVLLGFLPRSRSRLWGFACLVPFAVLCLLASVVMLFGESWEDPAMVTQRSSIPLGQSHINTYYDDNGLAGDSNVMVQQEPPLIPGILLVHPILDEGEVDDVTIKVLNRHHIQCDYNFEDANPPEAKQHTAWVF
jgi:hypothetical protein